MGSSKPPPATAQSWTIGRVVKWATEDFQKRGFETARLDAELLLAHALKVDRVRLIIDADRPLAPAELATYRQLIQRRRAREPIAYIRERREFYGLDFCVDRRVLIPRPDTEILVDLALAREPATVVDVGTGSGCIAISLAVHLPEAFVYAIEISPAALAVARRNVERHGVAGRVRLMAGDVLSPRPGPVDLIVSNPPYIPTGQCASLPASVRDHEPRLALDGGLDGLETIQRLMAQALAVLHPSGGLLVEIGADQGKAAVYLARTYFPDATIRVHPDLAGRDRVLEVQT